MATEDVRMHLYNRILRSSIKLRKFDIILSRLRIQCNFQSGKSYFPIDLISCCQKHLFLLITYTTLLVQPKKKKKKEFSTQLYT